MRADRLLSLMMLLQKGGKVTASSLAEELGVSTRTIYRDLEALEIAGVPIYTERGPGGGCGLLEEFKTDLTGMTQGEVKALFLLNVPGPISDLGLSQEFKGALNKLAASIPGPRRGEDQRVRQRILIDWESPSPASMPESHLLAIQQALWQDRRLLLTLELGFQSVVERQVDPYGLVNRDNTWHLICRSGDQERVYLVSRIINATLLQDTFRRDEQFDLESFWSGWWTVHEANRPSYQVAARVTTELRHLFPQRFFVDRLMEDSGKARVEEGWIKTRMRFSSFHEAQRWILAGGGAIEVLEPEALRLSIIDFAQQISGLYEDQE